METHAQLTPLDRLFLERAVELAARGIGNTSPNPPVGAVVVRDGRILGEGYHHRAGDAHAETNALRDVRDASGSTMYVSLEPCNHVGRTPACSPALADAGVSRVVVGALDPNPKTNGAGVSFLRERGVRVDVTGDERVRAMIEPFGESVGRGRPYLALKMAMSLDGFITSEPDVQEWITSEEERLYVRDLRIAHDAVMVGAGTVRVDDPMLTVRPPHHRLHDYVRVVACSSAAVDPRSRIFVPATGYAKTIVLAPAGARDRFAGLARVADVLFAGGTDAAELDLAAALCALRAERGVQSVLCEGGPALAGGLVAANLCDRLVWAIAPVLLRGDRAVPALTGSGISGKRLRFDRVENVGPDVVISGVFERV
ncbi:MAG: bifunctional diaminohydroxyphosphoribosylaminopyrimidine deaminase/5-amino-6-(5-phosphoribosylamino)uracil reductase RibD [Vulcanimicrobiaceae bacterium]